MAAHRRQERRRRAGRSRRPRRGRAGARACTRCRTPWLSRYRRSQCMPLCWESWADPRARLVLWASPSCRPSRGVPRSTPANQPARVRAVVRARIAGRGVGEEMHLSCAIVRDNIEARRSFADRSTCCPGLLSARPMGGRYLCCCGLAVACLTAATPGRRLGASARLGVVIVASATRLDSTLGQELPHALARVMAHATRLNARLASRKCDRPRSRQSTAC